MGSKRDAAIGQIRMLPDILIDDVLEYINYLKAAKLGKIECAAQSESSLAKDWLMDEEEKAWRDL